MRVQVLNRQQAEECLPRDGWVMISISTPGDSPAALQEGWEAVLRLLFHDVTRFVPGIPGLVLFTETDAEMVQAFVEQHLDKDFIVHCDAGVSRSMAVGVFLRDVYGADLEIVSNQPTNPTRFANMFANALVLRKLKEKHWLAQLEKGKDRGRQ